MLKLREIKYFSAEYGYHRYTATIERVKYVNLGVSCLFHVLKSMYAKFDDNCCGLLLASFFYCKLVRHVFELKMLPSYNTKMDS